MDKEFSLSFDFVTKALLWLEYAMTDSSQKVSAPPGKHVFCSCDAGTVSVGSCFFEPTSNSRKKLLFSPITTSLPLKLRVKGSSQATSSPFSYIRELFAILTSIQIFVYKEHKFSQQHLLTIYSDSTGAETAFKSKFARINEQNYCSMKFFHYY